MQVTGRDEFLLIVSAGTSFVSCNMFLLGVHLEVFLGCFLPEGSRHQCSNGGLCLQHIHTNTAIHGEWRSVLAFCTPSNLCCRTFHWALTPRSGTAPTTLGAGSATATPEHRFPGSTTTGRMLLAVRGSACWFRCYCWLFCLNRVGHGCSAHMLDLYAPYRSCSVPENMQADGRQLCFVLLDRHAGAAARWRPGELLRVSAAPRRLRDDISDTLLRQDHCLCNTSCFDTLLWHVAGAWLAHLPACLPTCPPA